MILIPKYKLINTITRYRKKNRVSSSRLYHVYAIIYILNLKWAPFCQLKPYTPNSKLEIIYIYIYASGVHTLYSLFETTFLWL